MPALVRLAEEHHGESIIVVAHGGVIATVLAAVAPEQPFGRIRNGSVHSFRHDEGTLTLVDFDDPIEEQSELQGGEDFEAQNALARRERDG